MPTSVRRQGVIHLAPWVFVVAFAITYFSVAVYGFSRPRQYEATVRLRFHPDIAAKVRMDWDGVRESAQNALRPELFAQHLVRFERETLRLAYGRESDEGDTDAQLRRLLAAVEIEFDETNREFLLRIRHSDRHLAARLATLLLNQVIAQAARDRLDAYLRETEMVKSQAEAIDQRLKGASDELSQDQRSRLEGERHVLVIRLRDLTMINGMSSSFLQVMEKPVVPGERAFLLAPILKWLIGGFLLALAFGAVAARAVARMTNA